MKVYEAKLKANTEVESFSLVLGAAVETKLSHFAEEIETPTFFANEEKRIIYSVAMRPNKMIFRKDVNGEPANVFFSVDTVEQIQQSYFKANNLGKVKMNLNHSTDKVDGVYPLESWIVENPEIDKSKTLMMSDVQPKDLIIGYKIDNNDVWENFVKTGGVDGLSVEAYLDYEINNQVNMTVEEKKENFFTHMMKFFATDMPAEKTAEEIAAEAVANNAPDAKEELDEVDYEAKCKELEAKVADLEAKLAEYEAKEVEAATQLETMKSEKEKIETDFATFKADKEAIKNVPNEAVKNYSEMNNAEKVKFNRNK